MKPVKILLVEDNPGDILLIQKALEKAKIHTDLAVVNDGVEAMELLHGKGAFHGSSRPDLILLDLNLPRMDGHEVLAEVRNDPTLETIPIVVLTTSDDHADIVASYELHANCFITKPIGLDGMLKVVQSIDQFWFSVVTLPSPN